MSEGNCTINNDISFWVTAAVVEHFIACFIGSICNAASIWCLFRCQRIVKAVKLQLVCLFGLQLTICVVMLPLVTYLYYAEFFCFEIRWSKQVQFFISILNSIFLQGERLNFMVLAVYRAVAVICPNKYRKLATKKIIISLQVGIFLIITPPWLILGFSKSFRFSRMNGSVMRLRFESGTYYMRALYGIYYCLPFVITFIACTIMMIAILRQTHQSKYLSQNKKNMDQVASTLRVILLANILVDGPHVIFHLLDEYELISVVTHMAFFLHLVLDPAIFVGMNRHYRTEISKKMSSFWGPCLSCPCCHCDDNVDNENDDAKDVRQPKPFPSQLDNELPT